MRRALLLLPLLAACAHAPTGNAPPEVLATPAGSAQAREAWTDATLRLARVAGMRGELERERTLLEDALERARADGDAASAARLQAGLAVALGEEAFSTRSGVERGLAVAGEAQAAARSAGVRDAEARALHAEGFMRYGVLLWNEGKDFQVPRGLFEKSRASYRDLGDRSGVAQETFFLGLTFEQEGKTEEAGARYRQARALAEEIGDRSTLSYACRHLGGLAEARGDLDEALALQRRSLALREEIGFARLVPFALIAVGDVERKKRTFDDARASYARALAEAQRLGSDPALVWAQFGLGSVDEAQGRLDAALGHYESAREAAARLGSKSWTEETAAAAEKVRKRLREAGLARESGTGG
jgi:tetratricopeptide (TPR) repeat protein